MPGFQPARIIMLPRLATTLALAFADPDRKARGSPMRRVWMLVLAAASWLTHAAGLFAYTVGAQAYTSPRGDVVVFVSRSGIRASVRRLLGMMALAGVFVIVLLGTFAFALVLPAWTGLLLLSLVALILGTVCVGTLVVLLRSPRAVGSSLQLVFHPPRRPYWTVQSLARDPRSRAAGLEFAKEVVRHVVPAGETVAIVAADERRARVYERFGFKRTREGGLVLTRRDDGSF